MGVKWKTIAIIFAILFIVETISFGIIFFLGVDIIQKEETCKSLCYDKEADLFSYYRKVCSCWKNGKAFYTEVIK